jgi:hypothetical protein
MIAQTLLAWLRLLALDGALARAEPRTLRYRVLHAAARLTSAGQYLQPAENPGACGNPGTGPPAGPLSCLDAEIRPKRRDPADHPRQPATHVNGQG